MKHGMLVLANYVVFIFIHKITGRPDGYCYENSLINGKEVHEEICCYNYYKGSKGTCTECPAGSYGKNCDFTRIAPYYGRFCNSVCNCKRCHHIYGCGEYLTTESSIYGKPTVFIERITEISSTEITKEWNKEVTSAKFENEKESAFSLEQIIVIIVTSSTSTAVSMEIVIICVLILRRLFSEKQRSGRAGTFNEVLFTNNDTRAQLSTPREHFINIQTHAIPESQYETVDESNMIEISGIRIGDKRSALRNTHISSSSSCDSKTSNASGVASEDTEGYLHPYNILEENWQSKGYQYSPCIVKNQSHNS